MVSLHPEDEQQNTDLLQLAALSKKGNGLMPSGVWLLFGRQEVANATFAFDLVIFSVQSFIEFHFRLIRGKLELRRKLRLCQNIPRVTKFKCRK